MDWRMEKKQHMRWTRCGAQMLLHARCAVINAELGSDWLCIGLTKYTADLSDRRSINC